jgi:hypothetical protein
MAIDGTWKVTVDTPMGAQESTMTLQTRGGELTGKSQSAMGTLEIKGGKVQGNKATWTADLTQPMPMKLEFELAVDGDSMTGSVKAGDFGTSPLKGTRVQ